MAGSIISIKIVGDGKDAKKAFDDVQDKAEKFDKKLSTIGKSLAGAFAADRVLQFGREAIKNASDLAESISKVNVVFGESAQEIKDWSTTAATSIGLSQRAALAAAGNFGNLFDALGLGDKRAADLSRSVVVLASDLASFNNTSVDDALIALQAGLVGEAEPLRRFGVNLSAARIEAEALRLGLYDGVGALDAAAKAQATYSIITQDTANAQGDFARTSEGAANKTKILEAKAEDLKTKLGTGLLPIVIDLTDAAIYMVDAFAHFGSNLDTLSDKINDTGLVKFVDQVTDKIPGLTGGFSDSDKLMLKWTYDMQSAGSAVGVLTTKVAGVIPNLSAFGAAIGRAGANAVTATRQFIDAAGSIGALIGRVGQFQILGGSIGAGISAGIADGIAGVAPESGGGGGGGGVSSNIEDAMDAVGEYLRAVAQKQVDDLNNVYSSIGASISLDSAANAVDDAKAKLQSLVDEFNGLPGRVADAEGTVGSLLAAATAITPEEQQSIDQAQAEVDKITKALQGVTDTVNAPASSFAGPSTVSQTSKISFSLNDLKVAENKLAAAKAAAVGPTRELEQAEKDLADLRERYVEIPKEIESAQRSLISAESALVQAKRRQIEAGKELLDQGPDAIQQYKDLAAAAGLSADEVNRLVAGMIAAGNAAGLVDVFGNGYLFQPPDQADATRRFVAGLASFDTGGIVGGPKGAAQLVVAHGGETILPTHKGSVATLPPITINAGFGADAQAIANAVRKALLDVQRKNGSLGLN